MLQEKFLLSSSNDLQENGWLLCGMLILRNHPGNSFTISQPSIKIKRESTPTRIIFASEFSSTRLIRTLRKTTGHKPELLTFFRSNSLTEPFRLYSARKGNLCLPQRQMSKGYQIRRNSGGFASGTERPLTLLNQK